MRSIDVTEPVAEGDLVFSAGLSGVVAEPLLYGRVVRVERPAGASSWEIWVQPAVPAAGPGEVLVLRTELRPARLADRRNDTGASVGAEQTTGPTESGHVAGAGLAQQTGARQQASP